MSEQMIQNKLYSENVTIFDKYTCLSLGATTVNDLIKSGSLKAIKVSKNLGKKPDVYKCSLSIEKALRKLTQCLLVSLLLY